MRAHLLLPPIISETLLQSIAMPTDALPEPRHLPPIISVTRLPPIVIPMEEPLVLLGPLPTTMAIPILRIEMPTVIPRVLHP